ncbi:glycosyltransferase [Saprospiraceae bacterium]|jgi:glycosyltransferase involved in cell wall biosynthesis|nr:glycosyltransferase [Bacteroidota bacterium]MDB4727608.1 glycosyltransferase [Saprospiraceae bacterium]MDF1867243.1 glycosyltransferase [Saprospiraceae bacterium]
MKNIVILSPAHPLRGGIASSTERLAQELQAFGHQVVLYSFSLQYPDFLFPGKTQFSSDTAPKDLDIRTKVNSVNPFNWMSVGLELKKLKPDLIITRFWLPFMGPSLGTVLRIAKSNGHTKTLCIADNIIPHESRPGDRILTNYFIKSIDSFIVMSRSVKDDIRQFSTQKPVEFIPHPIYDNYGKLVSREKALARLNLPEEDRYILFFGFIRDYKGLDLLLKSIADKRIQNRNVKLIVAGEYYGNQEFYEALIQSEEIEDQVILKTEFIPSEEVKYYFGAADLVVQPYKSATQSGISQLAYHFEKPMVVTRVGGLPEIVEHGKVGYVVDVKIDAISDAIVDFFENNRKEELEEGVRQNKTKFSWKNMVKGIEDLYLLVSR